MILFKPGQSYNRSITRQYLYEYYVKRVAWSRHSADKKDDGARFYYLAKSVKDYIIASGKKEFKYEEIQELIESMAILCFTNDMISYHIDDFINFMDTYLCDYEGS